MKTSNFTKSHKAISQDICYYFRVETAERYDVSQCLDQSLSEQGVPPRELNYSSINFSTFFKSNSALNFQ